MSFNIDQILQPNAALHQPQVPAPPNINNYPPEGNHALGRYVWVPGPNPPQFGPQYAPPTVPQYVPPAMPQYAPPTIPQYAPPTVPQYAPPNAEHEGSVTFSLEQVVCLMKQGAFTNFRGRRRRRGYSPYYNNNYNNPGNRR